MSHTTHVTLLHSDATYARHARARRAIESDMRTRRALWEAHARELASRQQERDAVQGPMPAPIPTWQGVDPLADWSDPTRMPLAPADGTDSITRRLTAALAYLADIDPDLSQLDLAAREVWTTDLAGADQTREQGSLSPGAGPDDARPTRATTYHAAGLSGMVATADSRIAAMPDMAASPATEMSGAAVVTVGYARALQSGRLASPSALWEMSRTELAKALSDMINSGKRYLTGDSQNSLRTTRANETSVLPDDLTALESARQGALAVSRVWQESATERPTADDIVRAYVRYVDPTADPTALKASITRANLPKGRLPRGIKPGLQLAMRRAGYKTTRVGMSPKEREARRAIWRRGDTTRVLASGTVGGRA